VFLAEGLDFSRRRYRFGRTGNDWDIRRLHDFAGFGLLAEVSHHVTRWADPLELAVFDVSGERFVLGEKAVSRMDRVDVTRARSLEERAFWSR